MDETTQLLLRLLQAAAAAHGVHEAQDLGGAYDEAWPQWYADHMAAGLTERGYRLVRTGDGGRDEP
jgi:hypothetical protein